MAEDLPPTNPYHDDAPGAPFVGRQRAFERLYQQLTDPEKAETTVLLGRADIGKTALLRHFGAFFDETFIGVYVPLAETTLPDETAWLQTLANRATAALLDQGVTAARAPEAPPDSGLRAWLRERYLPEVFAAVRRHRRLVFLLDDAESLLRAVEAGSLPADTFDYLHGLLADFRHLGFVLTLDARSEDDLPLLSPLAGLTNVVRLTRLTPDETALLIREPAQNFYAVSDEAVEAVHHAAGGEPRLALRFGEQLYRRWQGQPGQRLMTLDDVKAVMPAVYTHSAPGFLAAWQALSQTERLALTAVASLLYADPLAPIHPAALEGWLVETDYPLDSTAINAAVRSLEYREIIAANPIQITAGLMQTWLLENARLPGAAPSGKRRLWRAVGLALAAALLVLVALALAATPRSAPAAPGTPPPTVTLVATPEGAGSR